MFHPSVIEQREGAQLVPTPHARLTTRDDGAAKAKETVRA